MFVPKTIATLVVSALALSACGERPPEKKVATQVAAKVNAGEISVHQINYVLQRTPAIPQAQIETAKRKVLESLIDQELAVQQALEAKLERSPAVMETIEAARREILARAYLEQAGGSKGKPTDEDVKKFYVEHPELFANRKIYRLEEIVFAVTPERLASVKEQLGKGRPASEILAGLKLAGVEVGGGVSVKPAEQLSLDLLPKLAQVKEGQPQLLENGARAAIITVLATKPEPLDENKARPFIETYLSNQQKSESTRDIIKQLRDKAKIEYAGEFASAAAVVPVALTEKVAAEKTTGAPNEAAINKGIAGLK